MLVQNSGSFGDSTGIFSVLGNNQNGKKSLSFEKVINTISPANNDGSKAIYLQKKTVVSMKTEKSVNSVNQNTGTKEDPSLNTKAIGEGNEATENLNMTEDPDKAAKIEGLKGKETNDTVSDEEITTEQMEAVSVYIVTVTVMIIQALNITPEQLDGSMKELGLDFSDLTGTEGMSELFASVKLEGDVTKLFTDDEALSEFDSLMASVQKATEDLVAAVFNGEGPDEIDSKISELIKMIETKTGYTAEQIVSQDGNEIAVKTVKTKDNDETKAFDIGNEEETDIKTADQVLHTEESKSGTGAKTSDSGSDRSKDRGREDSSFDAFVNNVGKAFEAFKTDAVESTTKVYDISEIAAQILEKVKVAVSQEIKSIEIQLTPEALGKVKVTVQENNGVVTAKFTTESHAAKEAIEANLIQFKETLNEKGIKVENVEVAVSDFRFDENNGGAKEEASGHGSGKKHFTSKDEGISFDDDIDLVSQSYIDNGTSTVSYSA